ncbi:MAG: 50S ribosomal protein L4 [Bdellovibrionales bacterium]
MAKVEVLNWKKEKVGTVELPAETFEVEVKPAVLHAVVKWQLDSRRQGNAATKTKGLVSGGGKKPFKQKGTGNARQGSTRSPLMPGGGTTFGPEPRSYEFTMPKKMRRLGLKMALSHLLKEGKLLVVDSLSSSGKTKELSKNLKTIGFDKAVLVDSKTETKTRLASRNLAKYRYYGVEGINVFDLLKFDAAVISKSSIESIVQKCSTEVKR